MRTIDVDDFVGCLESSYCDGCHNRGSVMCDSCYISFAMDTADGMPTVEPGVVEKQLIAHGKWEVWGGTGFNGFDKDGDRAYRKAKFYAHGSCGYRSIIRHKFCPRCGCRMDL